MQVPFLNKNSEYTLRIAWCNVRYQVVTSELTRTPMQIPYSVVTAGINCKIQILHLLKTISVSQGATSDTQLLHFKMTRILMQSPRSIKTSPVHTCHIIQPKHSILKGANADSSLWPAVSPADAEQLI